MGIRGRLVDFKLYICCLANIKYSHVLSVVSVVIIHHLWANCTFELQKRAISCFAVPFQQWCSPRDRCLGSRQSRDRFSKCLGSVLRLFVNVSAQSLDPHVMVLSWSRYLIVSARSRDLTVSVLARSIKKVSTPSLHFSDRKCLPSLEFNHAGILCWTIW